MYSIDPAERLRQLLPPVLRQPVRLAWLEALLEPQRTSHQEYQQLAEGLLEQIGYTGQTITVEYVLNLFFNGGGAIRIITPGQNLQETHYFFEAENQPAQAVYFNVENGPGSYLYSFSEFAQDVDFIIEAPASLAPAENAMDSVLQNLRLSGRRYKFEYV